MIKFEINQKGGRIRLGLALKKLEKVISQEFKKDGIISIAIVNSAESRKLNKGYRGKNNPADVLTFTYKDDDSLGEIILSYQEVKKRAQKEKKKIKEVALFLIVHGICHIMGYSHKAKK
ncbi:rRNA maturation RNase YbeY, partial [Patescibacteria group bacterium]